MKRVVREVAVVMLGLVAGCADGPTRSEPLLWVNVVPRSATLDAVGDSLQLTVYATNGPGYPVTTDEARWSSLDEAVASVSATGLVKARSAGVARIRVELLGPGNADTATIAVRAATSTATGR